MKHRALIASLLIGLSLLGFIVLFEVRARNPTQVMMNVAGEEVHVADTWIEWTIVYETGQRGFLASDRSSILLSLLADPFGSNSYVHVKIPIQWTGGVEWPVKYAIASGVAKIYAGYPGASQYLGEVDLKWTQFTHQDPPRTIKTLDFTVGGNDAAEKFPNAAYFRSLDYSPALGINYGNPEYGTFLDIQTFLDKLGGAVPHFSLWVEVTQSWQLVQVTPSGWINAQEKEKMNPYALQGDFNIGKPVTITGPTATAGATKTGEWWIAWLNEPIITWRRPSYTLTRSATTVAGVSTTYTVTATTTIIPAENGTARGQAPAVSALAESITEALSKILGVPLKEIQQYVKWAVIIMLGFIVLFVMLLMVKALRWAAMTKGND